MKRRSIICRLFMLPILLCMFGWVCSGEHRMYAGASYKSYYICGGFVWGQVFIGYVHNPPYRGVFFGNEVNSETRFWPQKSTLGFDYLESRNFRDIGVPFWFLILIFSGVLWFVWRRSAPKRKGGAFPVVLDNDSKVQP